MNQSGSGLENILLIALGKAKIKERVRERKKGKKTKQAQRSQIIVFRATNTKQGTV